MSKFLHKLVHKILLFIYKDDAGMALYHTGELGQLAEIEYFGEGKPLTAVIITPDETGGFVVGYYSKEELEYTYDMGRE